MSYAETLLPEFDQEMASTRKVLERLPDDKLDWKAHPKSHTIGWNANHVADIPHWIVEVLTKPALDIAPADGPRYQTPALTSRREILENFDRNVAEARAAIAAAKDEDVRQPWSLLSGGQPIMAMPRAAMIRGMVLNHLIHHRAHLCVYYRLNEIPVPGMYGPSGDD
ncbi:DinB superfamily protein [Aquisphaera giovannonii]|uniref:DinB superfamily protein n=1 Tax=Aquisphaera giovannonii TaxID=406548 RepID=A0A5B9WCT4_9BACT|nr:DinB family protein [Aquisphaera giovannonii]QEH38478.1 DinB superfamily protein [Aquisphaera giovannonii]